MKHLAIVSGLLGLFLFFAYPSVSAAPFAYDEADYMFAASRGFLANYLDLPSLSFPDYVRAGLGMGSGPGASSAISLAARRSGDMFVYRHGHPPVYFYWLGALSHLGGGERSIRAAGLVFPVLSAIAIYLGCLWVLTPPQGTIAAVAGCALFLFSPAVIRASEIAPHQMFTLWFIVALALLAKLRSAPSRRLWYAVVITAAVAFCTMEIAFVLIGVVIVCGYLERRSLGLDWRLAGKSVAVFAATVVILHPATVTRLSFAKSYLFYAYLAVRRSKAWGDVTFFDTWAYRFGSSPVVWTAIGAAFVLWLYYRDLPGRRQALPFVLFGTMMVATMLRVVTTGLRYVLPFVPALAVFAAIVISGAMLRLRPNLRAAAMALLCAALVFDAHLYAASAPSGDDPRFGQLIAEIKRQNLGGGRLLVPHDDLPTVHYYFPGADLTPYWYGAALPAGRFDAILRMAETSAIVERIQ